MLMAYRKVYSRITASFHLFILLNFLFSSGKCQQQCIVPYQCDEMLLTFEQAVALTSSMGGVGAGPPAENKKQHLDLTWGQCRGMIQSGEYDSAVYCKDSHFCGGDVTTALLADTGEIFNHTDSHLCVLVATGKDHCDVMKNNIWGEDVNECLESRPEGCGFCKNYLGGFWCKCNKCFTPNERNQFCHNCKVYPCPDEPDECHLCLEFKCANNLCVLNEQHCDNANQCGDNSDELGCFVCLNTGLLVKPGVVCDGVDDCGDNSDEANCPVTSMDCGVYSMWSAWGCNCANETDVRTRDCVLNQCETDCIHTVETRECSKVSEWTEWTACNCGTAQRERDRTCDSPDPTTCEGCSLPLEDVVTCSQFDQWGPWSCFCEDKLASRSRTCLVEPCTECGGTSESDACNEYRETWDAWGQCDCTTSTQERSRAPCLSSLNDTCDICKTSLTETRQCGTFGNPVELFTCCMNGKQHKGYKKTCTCGTCLASTGELIAQGEIFYYNTTTASACSNLGSNDNPCFLCANSDIGLLASMTYLCDGKDDCHDGGGGSDESTEFCPGAMQDPCGATTKWGDWQCNCETQTEKRTRKCLSVHCNQCASLEDTRGCNETNDWGAWSACDCDVNLRSQSRQCTSTNTNTCAFCETPLENWEQCSMFNNWTPWDCDCGDHTAIRNRTSKVGPDDECGGLSAQSPCNLTSEWTEWSDCNCDFIYRGRDCTTELFEESCFKCNTPLSELFDCGIFGEKLQICHFNKEKVTYRRICICGKCETLNGDIILEGKEETIIEAASNIPGSLEPCVSCGGAEANYYLRRSQICDGRQDCPQTGNDEDNNMFCSDPEFDDNKLAPVPSGDRASYKHD